MHIINIVKTNLISSSSESNTILPCVYSAYSTTPINTYAEHASNIDPIPTAPAKNPLPVKKIFTTATPLNERSSKADEGKGARSIYNSSA